MKWVDEAETALSRVPFFVRRRVRKRVEEEAARRGAPVVLLGHVQDCQKRFLENMQSEVRGFQVDTCFGENGCPNRIARAKGMTEDLEAMLGGKDLRDFLLGKVKGPLKLHHEFRVSISDCPNGCSRPQIADVGILGACKPRVTTAPCTHCQACVELCREDAVSLDPEHGPEVNAGRCVLCGQCVRACPSGALAEEMRGYRIQLGGKLGRHPQLGRELDGLYSPEDTLHVVERCADFYMEHCRGGERFGEVLNQAPLAL